MGSKSNPEKYVGKRYGRLKIKSVESTKPRIIKGKQQGYRYYMSCICDCGNKKIIEYTSLVNSHTTSCGCKNKERLRKANYKHGQSRSYTWVSWSAMIQRCYDQSNTKYQKYGGVGIKVCDRWTDSEKGYINFYKDMGERPHKHTIDRKDGSKGYAPDNCRWATYLEQSNNQKSNVKIEWKGKTYNLSQLMRHLGIYTKSGIYYTRIARGWSVEDAFTKPIKQKK